MPKPYHLTGAPQGLVQAKRELFRKGISQRILRLRREKGLTQKELAGRLGYHNSTAISQIERGISDIGAFQIVELAVALGCSVDQLLGIDKDSR